MNQSRSTQQIRVGMVVWNGLPAALPNAGETIGGLETGAWTLAIGLSQYTDVRPLFVVRSRRYRIPNEVSGVSIVARREMLAKVRNRFAESVDLGPPLRFKQFRASLLWQFPLLAMGKLFKGKPVVPMAPDPRLEGIEVDAWAGFGVNSDSARVIATAKQCSVPSIIFLESNADLDPRIATGKDFVNRYGETAEEQRFAIEHASTIVCQSRHQIRLLKMHFDRSGILIRNPIDRQVWTPRNSAHREYILWIGRYDEFHKRPKLAMEIAEKCPTLKFRMIINRQDPDVERKLRSRMPPNIELIDYVPFDRMPQQFAGAKAFLCTGNPDHEGFPNVLLQSAAAQTPICSLHDFDDFLRVSGAGASCDGDLESAADQLQKHASEDTIDWDSVEAYLDRYHSQKAVAISAAELVRDITASIGAP